MKTTAGNQVMQTVVHTQQLWKIHEISERKWARKYPKQKWDRERMFQDGYLKSSIIPTPLVTSNTFTNFLFPKPFPSFFHLCITFWNSKRKHNFLQCETQHENVPRLFQWQTDARNIEITSKTFLFFYSFFGSFLFLPLFFTLTFALTFKPSAWTLYTFKVSACCFLSLQTEIFQCQRS